MIPVLIFKIYSLKSIYIPVKSEVKPCFFSVSQHLIRSRSSSCLISPPIHIHSNVLCLDNLIHAQSDWWIARAVVRELCRRIAYFIHQAIIFSNTQCEELWIKFTTDSQGINRKVSCIKKIDLIFIGCNIMTLDHLFIFGLFMENSLYTAWPKKVSASDGAKLLAFTKEMQACSV